MGVEETPPDLVMRAMGRLGRKVPVPETKKDAEISPDQPIAAREEILHRPSGRDSVRTNGEDRVTEEKAVVEISSAAMAAHGLFSLASKNKRSVEEFRVIKRQVLGVISKDSSSVHGKRNRLVMITSALPGEGKTHTALNLAFAIAEERDRKVLLVDADVYRHSAIDYLGIKAERGWIDHLNDGNIALDDTILKTSIDNLSVLPAGKEASNIPELLSSRRMAAFVSEILERHPDEIILFDGLPCLISNEPAILSGLVGQIVFVVSALQTPKEKVRASLGIISSCPNISLVLNKAEPMLTDQFGKYGYGYDYNYRKTA